MSTRRTLAVSLIALAFASGAHAQEQRLPEPDTAALSRAESTVKRLFRSDFAKTDANDMRDLAIKLLSQAAQTVDDAAARFVLYREAAELAAKAGDLVGGLLVIDELGEVFETDVGALKVRVVKAAEAGTGVPRKLLGQAALATVPDALASRDPKAEELIAVAAAAAAKVNSAELKAGVEARRSDLKDVMRAFEGYRAALVTVQRKPDDAEANGVIGRYACFVRGDWTTGLPRLAKGGDAQLKALADADLASPQAAPAQVKVADGWWDFGETAPAWARRQVFGRAARWYGEALPRLQGLSQTKARDRVATFSKDYPRPDGRGTAVFAPYVGMWEIRYTDTSVRRYVFDVRGNAYWLRDNRFYRSRLVPAGETMHLSFERTKSEKIAIKDGELLVQHFHPPTRRVATGIGKKNELPERKAGATTGGSFRDIAGTWISSQSDNSYRLYIFGPKGTGVFMTQDGIFAGRLTRKDDHIILNCNDDKICRIKPVAGGLRIDTFHPASTYPNGVPKVVATGLRLSR